MTIYTSQPAMVEVSAKDFGGTTQLTDAEIQSVTARVLDADNEEYLEETELEWNADTQTWQLVWQTPLSDGTYMVEVRAYGMGEAIATPAYKRVRIAKRPID